MVVDEGGLAFKPGCGSQDAFKNAAATSATNGDVIEGRVPFWRGSPYIGSMGYLMIAEWG